MCKKNKIAILKIKKDNWTFNVYIYVFMFVERLNKNCARCGDRRGGEGVHSSRNHSRRHRSRTAQTNSLMLSFHRAGQYNAVLR